MRSSTDETTGAVVSCRQKNGIETPLEMIKRIKSAVTDWVKVTKAGMHEWKNSSQDFNIGDLSTCYTDEDLKKLLKRYGIEDLEIWTFSSTTINHPYTYDTILVRRAELEE
jgi:hypothetical protein